MRKINAFTLIELLVVIAIIGTLSALIIVGMSSTTQKATIAKAQAFSHSVDSALVSSKISEWNFNNLSGTVDQDISSVANFVTDTWGSNNGTAVGTPDLKDGTNCITGKCLNFNGSTDYINCGNSTFLQQITNVVTISAWVKTSKTSETIIDKYGSGSYGPLFSIVGGELYFITYEPSSGLSMTGQTTGITVNDNNWHNVSVVANCPAQILTFYKDGIKYELTGRNNIIWGTGGNLYVGYRNKAGSEAYFDGLMDDVRIYNSVIPTSQIQQNYFAGLNKLFAKQRIEVSEYQNRIVELKSNYAQN